MLAPPEALAYGWQSDVRSFSGRMGIVLICTDSGVARGWRHFWRTGLPAIDAGKLRRGLSGAIPCFAPMASQGLLVSLLHVTVRTCTRDKPPFEQPHAGLTINLLLEEKCT